ncbi:MAG: YciI family protein [Steroidobacteraceae bacterium]
MATPATPSYFVVRRARGPAWNAAAPLRAQVLWNEHAAFMDALTEEGFVVLGGPLGGTAGAMLIVDAPDEAEVRKRLAEDPWERSGHLVVERINAWTILLHHRNREFP